MVRKIIWSGNAVITFGHAHEYLLENFSQIEAGKFAVKIERKLQLLKSNPCLGSKVSKLPNVHKTVINKRIYLYYRYKPLKKEIIILAFRNTLQNPKRLKI